MRVIPNEMYDHPGYTVTKELMDCSLPTGPKQSLATILQATNQRKQARKWKQVAIVASLLFILALLPAVKPFALRAAANSPILGPLARKIVLSDAGLNWAWENGYLLDSPLELKQDDYKLTIVGYLADPIQTSFIYLLAGPGLDQKLDVGQELCGVWFQGKTSTYVTFSRPLQTPLGNLRVAQMAAVAPEGEKITISLGIEGELVQSQLWVSPEPIAKLSSEQKLDQSITIGDNTLTLRRMVRTPAQIMYEITSEQPFRVTTGPFLRLSDGSTLASNRDARTFFPPRGVEWFYVQMVFDPPQDATAAIASLEIEQILLPKELDGPTIDPTQGLAQATIIEGGVQVELQASERKNPRPGLAVEIRVKGYDGELEDTSAPILEWDCYTATGEVYDSRGHEILYSFGRFPEGMVLQHFWRPTDADEPIVKVVAKEILLPHGPIVFDLR